MHCDNISLKIIGLSLVLRQVRLLRNLITIAQPEIIMKKRIKKVEDKININVDNNEEQQGDNTEHEQGDQLEQIIDQLVERVAKLEEENVKLSKKYAKVKQKEKVLERKVDKAEEVGHFSERSMLEAKLDSLPPCKHDYAKEFHNQLKIKFNGYKISSSGLVTGHNDKDKPAEIWNATGNVIKSGISNIPVGGNPVVTIMEIGEAIAKGHKEIKFERKAEKMTNIIKNFVFTNDFELMLLKVAIDVTNINEYNIFDTINRKPSNVYTKLKQTLNKLLNKTTGIIGIEVNAQQELAEKDADKLIKHYIKSKITADSFENFAVSFFTQQNVKCTNITDDEPLSDSNTKIASISEELSDSVIVDRNSEQSLVGTNDSSQSDTE